MQQWKVLFSVLSVFCCFMMSARVSGQNKIVYPKFLYEGDANEKQLYILFQDSITKSSDTLWLHNINPYNKLPFEPMGRDKRGNFYYQLTGEYVRNLLPPEVRERYEPERRAIPINDSVYYAQSLYLVSDDPDRFVAISFTLEIYDRRAMCIGVIGAVTIYMSNGEQIFKIDKLKTNVGQLAISGSGDYLSYNYGFSDEHGDLLKCGFRLYDINKKKVILDKGTNTYSFPRICNDLILNGDYTIEENPMMVYYVFNTKTKILYTKKYKIPDTPALRGSNSEGFIFIDSKGNKRTEVFSSFDQQSYE